MRDVFGAVTAAGIGERDYQLARRLFDGAADREIAGARGALVDDDAREQERRERVIADVRGVYGQERGEELLERARRFVAAQKPLMDAIDRAGAGNDPAVVTAIVEHVHATDWRG